MTAARALCVLAACAVTGGAGAAQEVGIPIGTVPPAAEVEDLEGNVTAVQDLVRDRPALIEFWATWCPVCEALAPAVLDAHARFGDRVAFVVVAVGVNQSPRAVRRHLERTPSPLPHVFDRRGAAVRAFRAPTTGYVVVLDAGGRVAYTGVGDDQDLAAAIERVLTAP